MSWRERIQPAAYTSPGGTRTLFIYENVSRTSEKKTTAFEFPDVDGTFIQDLGVTGRRYPFRVIFSGDDYDQEAVKFEASLNERGAGRLEHPIYGNKVVVPTGSITRRDDLKTGANQAIIELSFWESINIIYPTGVIDPASSVLDGVTGFNDSMAGQFSAIDLDSVGDQADFKSGFGALLDTAKSGLRTLADSQASISNQFNAVFNSISNGIDILVGDPLTLAFQTMIMLQAPARALTLFQARLDAYSNLLNSIIKSPDGGVGSVSTLNGLTTGDLFASTYVASTVLSSVNNQFATKPDAINAAAAITEQLDELIVWRDNNFESLGEIDTGESYQSLLNVVALASGFLVDISFDLQQERRVILDRARNPIELTAELYGVVDAKLDFLIQSNALTGSEILEIPAGREIVYYV